MLGWVFLSALQTFLSVWECDIRVNTCEKQHGVCEAVVFFICCEKKLQTRLSERVSWRRAISLLHKFKERLPEFS